MLLLQDAESGQEITWRNLSSKFTNTRSKVTVSLFHISGNVWPCPLTKLTSFYRGPGPRSAFQEKNVFQYSSSSLIGSITHLRIMNIFQSTKHFTVVLVACWGLKSFCGSRVLQAVSTWGVHMYVCTCVHTKAREKHQVSSSSTPCLSFETAPLPAAMVCMFLASLEARKL